ncbi:DUF2797 domain-containing protein [Natronomonas salina]|uniref:DUF2797 domain-containing protein n=1 Tax=Natronomonas salina TaxID=1710540 RepID=UPI0015B712EA|nr:DUF2797 domain-containing protein [Natronomonas salina]QLD88444.1 DUF2797 domain-containing protein [Natronomonas salina]
MQVVGYETGAGTDDPAALLVAVDGAVDREPLAVGRELSYTLGERRCAGTFDGADHVACEAARAPYCEAHDSTWICARCTGTCLKAEMDCHQEHAVYLAAFAPDTFKVGVTKRRRLETRFREQGADRGAHIYTVADGRIAREIEAEIAAETPLPDAVRVPTKVDGMARTVDEAAWEDLLAEFDVKDTYAFDYGFDLDAAPVAETLASGTVRGTKGRVLVLERDGGVYAVDMRDLVGYELREGTSSRELQSSLGAFG